MPVQLKDATIKVKLDLEESERKVESVEEKLEDNRREEERQERRDRDKERRTRRPGGRGAAVGLAAVRGGLGRVAGLLATVTGVAALVELLLPQITEAVIAILPEALKKSTGIDDKIRSVVNTILEDVTGEGLANLKALFGGIEGAKAIARSQIIAGQQPTPEDVKESYLEEMRFRREQERLRLKQERITRGLFGKALGEGAKGLWQ